MNYFKAAEQELSSVPTLEKALNNLIHRKHRILESGKPPEIKAIDYSKPFINSHDVNDTLNELLELSECSKNIAATQRRLDEINRVISQLDEKHKNLVNLWYIESCSKEQVMEEMRIESLSTLYNLRNKAVAEFALLYYGAAAMTSV